MSVQSNLNLAREVYNHFSNDEFDAVLEHASADIEVFFAPTGQTFHGLEGFSQFMQGFKIAFPNVRIEVENQMATEEYVVTEFRAVGTHTGPLMTPDGEIPPTGRTAEWPVCEVWRIKGGKLVALNNYQDFGSVMRQLGLV